MPWRSALSDEYCEDFLELWWCSTNVQLADNLTKMHTPSALSMIRCLEQNMISLGKEGANLGAQGGWIRPRPTQRAHSFGAFQYLCYDILNTIVHNPDCHCECIGRCKSNQPDSELVECPPRAEQMLAESRGAWLALEKQLLSEVEPD